MVVMRYLKRGLKKTAKKALYGTITGRLIDKNQPEKGRFTHDDVKPIVEQTMMLFEQLLMDARLERYRSRGNRYNVMLAVFSLASYRTLRASGINTEYATELFCDIGWKVYCNIMAFPLFIGRLRYRDPHKRLVFLLKTFMRFPFNQPEDREGYLPGYKVKYWAEKDRFCTDWSNCPPFNYFQQVGTDEEKTLFHQSWCMYDYIIPQLISKEGRYERTHTLSLGDEICDMRWYGKSTDKTTNSQNNPST